MESKKINDEEVLNNEKNNMLDKQIEDEKKIDWKVYQFTSSIFENF